MSPDEEHVHELLESLLEYCAKRQWEPEGTLTVRPTPECSYQYGDGPVIWGGWKARLVLDEPERISWRAP